MDAGRVQGGCREGAGVQRMCREGAGIVQGGFSEVQARGGRSVKFDSVGFL